ncbi:MAG TPA: hypothetical protein VHX14_21305 [Thermoanaerobaculia bacterium]|jgi:hypothetical protein|nr:hypothetical protein [Thermoanaerobaculia bacterium]
MLAASSLSFAGAFYLASSWNWAPVELPIPGPALSVEEGFDITTSGSFRFEASVPMKSADTAIEDLPPVSSDLEISIARPGTPTRKFVITKFRAGGRGSTDLYSADVEIALQRGSYTLRVQNRAVTQPFADRGAVLTLTRFVHPTEFYLQGVLFRGIGWVGLICGLAMGVFTEVFAVRGRPSPRLPSA